MRVVRGANPDFADFDEIDPDILEAVEEFHIGTVTYDELKSLIGADAARAHLQSRGLYDYDIDSLFDDPENY